LLGDHREIAVDDAKAPVGDHLDDTSEKVLTIRVLPGCITRRKVITDVAESSGAQERIRERVQENIRVAMPVEAPIKRDDLSTEHETTTGDKPVHVIALTDPIVHRVEESRGRRSPAS